MYTRFSVTNSTQRDSVIAQFKLREATKPVATKAPAVVAFGRGWALRQGKVREHHATSIQTECPSISQTGGVDKAAPRRRAAKAPKSF